MFWNTFHKLFKLFRPPIHMLNVNIFYKKEYGRYHVFFHKYIFVLLSLRSGVNSKGPRRERISQVGLRRNIRAEGNNRPLALMRYQLCWARTTASAEWAGASVQGHTRAIMECKATHFITGTLCISKAGVLNYCI